MKQKIDKAKRIRIRHSKFRLDHPVGGLRLDGKAKIPALKFGKLDIPTAIDNRAYCTAVEDQGDKPWCAAYSAAAFAENVLWRRTGRVKQIEVAPVYEWAKRHDGLGGDGTTLDCALKGLLATTDVFGPACRVRSVGGGMFGGSETDAKVAIHRFGCFLGGFDISSEWYDIRGGKYTITGAKADSVGGHAVLVVGYNERGVWIENSWGTSWGDGGFALVSWEAFRKQFFCGAAVTNCLDGFK